MRWKEQIQSKEEGRMASGGRKKLFGSVISGAPFIKGLQLLNHRGEDSFSLSFIWFRKSILVKFYYGLSFLNWEEMSWLMITIPITLNHWITLLDSLPAIYSIFVTKKVCVLSEKLFVALTRSNAVPVRNGLMPNLLVIMLLSWVLCRDWHHLHWLLSPLVAPATRQLSCERD